MTTEHPAVIRWRERFSADAGEALGLVLTSKISLGSYDRARPAEILSQILTEADLERADAGLLTWLAGLIGSPTPAGLSGKRFAEALVECFRLITLLHLTKTHAWCAQRHGELRTWLRGFYFGRSRDPEAALLVALTQNQTDRSLLALWQGIVRRGKPVEHVRHALTGLRLMPADDAGKVERGVPRALLQGLLDFGDAQASQGERKGADWLMEVDFLAAVYPLSPDSWGRKFREAVQAREPSSSVKKWLDQRYPLALKPFESGAHKGPLQPPYFKDIEPLLQKLSSNYDGVRPRLKQFFDESRHYCRESGDSSYLVRSFCFAGNRLLEVDPTWARDLAHEAAVWEPTNPHTWSLLAQALEAEGDWRRAEAIYWQARRRFPEDVKIHSQLAHAQLVHGSGDLGEAIYRQAIQLFPDNSVCRCDLGHTLRILGRFDEALGEYRQAQELFHRDVTSATALADLLIEMKRLDKAADALTWAEQITPHDDERRQQRLAQIRERLKRAQSGQPIAPKKMHTPPEITGGSLSAFSDITGSDISHAPTLGKATLLRRKANGGLSTARELIDTLPESPEKLIERGLWEAATNDWKAAANWFDSVWQGYEGDGVLRVHRQRAHVRADEVVDWSFERAQYPDLASIILTEERGQPPHLDMPEGDERSQEQAQDAWFASLVSRNDLMLRDLAEEDYLSARHMV
jgi:tetratricopeptide (TPR) repeat protein